MTQPYYKKIQDYCEQQSSAVSDDLVKLERETYLKTLAPQMLSGHLQVLFIQHIIRMNEIKHILEIGTFTGYATLGMAQALPPEGLIDTIEVNEEFKIFHNTYFQNEKAKINVIYEDALKALPKITGPYDLIYIDAGKHEYEIYYRHAMRLLKSGGILLADNVLWSGKVLEPGEDQDALAIRRFTETIKSDPDIASVILIPIRDGLLMAGKK